VLKLALVTGLNEYEDSSISRLRGCVNDSLLITALLKKAGFRVTTLNDYQATQRKILNSLRNSIVRLINSPEEGYLVYWNSSHGYQVRDWDGDEWEDGKDEAICTYDTDPSDPLIDDKFADLFSMITPNVKVFFGSDSCHSESLHRKKDDLADLMTAQREIIKKKFDTIQEESINAKLWIPPEKFLETRKPFNLTDYLKDIRIGAKSDLDKARRLFEYDPRGDKNLLFASACESDEVSWDSYINEVNRHHGIFSYCFAITVLDAWNEGNPITYKGVISKAKKMIHDHEFEDQNPTIEGKKEMRDEPVFGYAPEETIMAEH